MPFVNQKQRAACYAEKARNPNSKWDCDQWNKETPKNIPKGKMGGSPKYRGKPCMECGGKMPDGGMYSKGEIPIEKFDAQSRINQFLTTPVVPPTELPAYQGPQHKRIDSFDLGLGINSALTVGAQLSGMVDRGRQNQYMYDQYSSMGQLNPIPVSNFQPNKYRLYNKYGGSLRNYPDGGKIKPPEPKYNFSYTGTERPLVDSLLYKNNFEGLLKLDPYKVDDFYKMKKYGVVLPYEAGDARNESIYTHQVDTRNAYEDAIQQVMERMKKVPQTRMVGKITGAFKKGGKFRGKK